MQIKIKGEMTIAELRQLLLEMLREIEDDYAIRYSRGATLYVNPTNGFGENVTARNAAGGKVEKLYSNGPYRSAADENGL